MIPNGGFDTKLTLWASKKKLIVVCHKGRTALEIEIACCKSRIDKGEATHYVIESLSSHGSTYIDELRPDK